MDPNSEFRPLLHEINLLRLDWIHRHADLAGKRCLTSAGGGLLSEAMSGRGKPSPASTSRKGAWRRRLHLLESGGRGTTASAPLKIWREEEAGAYDVVTCMEMLEHRSQTRQHHRLLRCNWSSLAAMSSRPSTATSRPMRWRWSALSTSSLLPKGTHDYAKFIKPSELSRWAKSVELEVDEVIGMSYNPLSKAYSLGRDTDVNYLVTAVRDA